jgi:hypothetical protein
MKFCSKCKIQKPLTEYYTYFHSTQNKFRTRNICQDCMKKQKNEYKAKIRQEKLNLIQVPNQEEIIQPGPPELIPDGFKECIDCKLILPLTDYYKNSKSNIPFRRCKKCQSLVNKKGLKEAIELKRVECGGSERVPTKPNTYTDEYQKAQTFWIMELMGWTYNDNGVWSKDGIKDKDKFWVNVKKPVKPPKPEIPKRTKWTAYGKQMNELREQGMIFNDIAKIFGCSKPTVIKAVRLYNGKY